jgi:Zn finger protein HypA/HybF involved in hydrogenase expression
VTTYQRRRAAGLCPLCGRLPLEGQVLCRRCGRRGIPGRQNDIEYARARYERLKAEGRCTRCGAKAENSYIQCTTCRSYMVRQRLIRAELGTEGARDRERQSRIRTYRRASRLCVRCGEALQVGLAFMRCPTCRQKEATEGRAKRRRHKERILTMR